MFNVLVNKFQRNIDMLMLFEAKFDDIFPSKIFLWEASEDFQLETNPVVRF